jgi:hypothetical protein
VLAEGVDELLLVAADVVQVEATEAQVLIGLNPCEVLIRIGRDAHEVVEVFRPNEFRGGFELVG